MGAKLESKKIKKGDFIELDYTGRMDDGTVFDTTIKKIAEANNLNKKVDYKPVVICVGESHILPALEEGLEGKKLGKHSFNLEPENAFGKKSAKMLKLVPLKVFKKQDIVPYNGLEVNVDGMFGIVRSASGGRIIVDFNHPLSGRNLSYDLNVKSFIADDKAKLESLLKLTRVHYDSVSVKDKKAVIVLDHDIQKEIKDDFEKKVLETIKLKHFDYIIKKKTTKQ
jgi:FKBP-type peptidyl-prolyl cis-trans isomerase 2|tara:strand:- start:50 stop:724 length:675 start_codon:yes stop_codon:yes gene_type:complete